MPQPGTGPERRALGEKAALRQQILVLFQELQTVARACASPRKPARYHDLVAQIAALADRYKALPD